MSLHIPESDWRHFKELHRKLLERYCAHILEEVTAAIQNGQGNAHDRYLKVYALIQKRDKQMATAFDDFRRSTALMQLGIMRRMNLLTEEDLSGFSDQTRARVQAMASL